MESSMASQLLEAEGIPTSVKPLNGGYGVLGVNPFLPHRVYVPIEMLEQAHTVLSHISSLPDPPDAPKES